MKNKLIPLLLGLLAYAGLFQVYGYGQNTLAGKLTVQQTIQLTGDISPTAISSNQNDYAPTGYATAAIMYLSSDAARTITGLAGGLEGRQLQLFYSGTGGLTLANESASSTAANRFSLGADLVIPAGGSLVLSYDSVASRWKAAGRPVLTKSDLGLGNVDNTSDVNKPVSTAQTAAFAPINDLRFTAVSQSLQSTLINKVRAKLEVGEKPTFMFYGDSLTAGASGGRVADTFAGAAWKTMGYGGQFIELLSGNTTGSGFEMGIGSSAVNCYTGTTYESLGFSTYTTIQSSGLGLYGLDTKAVYIVGAGGSTTLYFKLFRQGFTKVTLYYLEKSGGGSFTWGKDGDLVAVSCSGASTAMKSVTRSIWTGSPEDNVVAVNAVTGDVAFYAIKFENDSSGAVLAVGGTGSAKAQDLALVNATAFANYVSNINPDVIFLNLGTNDYSFRTAAQWKTDMQTIITNMRAGSPTAPIVITVPYTANSLKAGGAFPDYQAKVAELITDNANTYTFWWRDIVGEGGTGWLIDSVHPNAQGCALLGRAHFEAIGGAALKAGNSVWPYYPTNSLPSSLVDTARNGLFTASATDWASNNGSTFSYTQNVGISVVCTGSNQGAGLWHGTSDSVWASMVNGSTYYVQFTVSALTNGNVLFYVQNADFSQTLQRLWPTGSLATNGTGTYYSVVKAGTTTTNGGLALAFLGNASNTTFTISNVKISLLPTGPLAQLGIQSTGTGTRVVTNTGPTISAPTITGHATVEGVTATGATGTGNAVYSISPTLTGSPIVGGVTTTSGASTGQNTVTAAASTDYTVNAGSGNQNTVRKPTGTGFDRVLFPAVTGTNNFVQLMRNLSGASSTVGDMVGVVFATSSDFGTGSFAYRAPGIWGILLSNSGGDNNRSGLRFYGYNGAAQTLMGSWDPTNGGTGGDLTIVGAIKSSNANNGVGYATGAGGTVTQSGSRSNTVTIAKVTGTITTDTTSLAAGASASFTVTCVPCAIGDVPVLAIRSGQTNKKTEVKVTAVAAGSFEITVFNADPSTAETGAIIINYALLKAVSS